MDELFSLHSNGLFLRREALEFGFDDRDLTAARRAGVIHRVRHGAYAPVSVWRGLDPIGQLSLRGRAVMLTHHGNVALSHTSGAAEHGLRLWQPDTTRVHVYRLDGGPAGRHGDVVYHVGDLHRDAVQTKDGVPLLGPAHCAIGAATLASVESGLVTLDSALDLDLATPDDLSAAYRSMAGWPGARRLQVILRLARPGAQSVGESRARYLFWTQHVPPPVLQFRVYDAQGNLVGITDFAWPDHGVLGEFDGRIKYGRLLRPGQSPQDAVFAEKVREDRLREATDWRMIRLVWDDLRDPATTGSRIHRVLARAGAA